jgi:RNA polymerase sigma factor (sigma-70 family)
VPTDDTTNSIDPQIDRLLRAKARKLIGHAGLRHQDYEDVVQHLAAGLVPRMRSFDPSQGDRRNFVCRLLQRLGAKLLRYLRAEKRNPHRLRPLQGADFGEPHAGPEATVHARRLGRKPAETVKQTDLAIDVASVMETLTPGERALAEKLLESGSIAEAARALGKPRTSLYTALRRLRQRYERAGLREILDNPSSSRAPTG